MGDYADAKQFSNAISFLESLTHPFVNLCSKDMPDHGSEEFPPLESFIASLENAWSKTLELGTTSTDITFEGSKFEGWFKLLAKCRSLLSKSMGPIFSDPLRILKKKIKKDRKLHKRARSQSASSSKKSKIK